MEQAPVDREATLALARAACRLLVKSGDGVLRLDVPLTDADIVHYLAHEDGFLHVPVRALGDVLVRGYTETLYREALGS